MSEPITPSQAPLLWPNHTGLEATTSKVPAKEELHAAEEEVASLYYLTTLKSLAAAQDTPQKHTVQATEKKAIEKSLLGRAKDWLWGIFGWGQKQPASELESETIINSENSDSDDLFAGGSPKLQPPETADHKRLSQSIAELNRELVNRLKDMAEFEEEMRKSSSSKLDKLIFLQLVHSSINQKKLKESSSLITQEELLGLHKKNQNLQKAHFSLVDAITSENKARNVLKWVNVGLTAITVGGSAIAFAVGGPLGILAVGMPLSLIGKGATMLSDGILKYRNDSKTGELVMIRQDTKANTSNITEKLSEMQICDSDIAALLKMIRQHLDNQSKAERASFGRNT